LKDGLLPDESIQDKERLIPGGSSWDKEGLNPGGSIRFNKYHG